jgi:hypothetical protein
MKRRLSLEHIEDRKGVFSERAVMTAEVLLTDAEWEQITAVCPGMPNEARSFLSSFISIYRRLPEYRQLRWRYDEAARLGRRTAELTKRIERYRNDASVPELLRPEWQKNVEGLDEVVGVLTLWTERFQETAKTGNIKLKVSGDVVQTLIGCLRLILGRELDRSKEVEGLIATVLRIADPGMKKNIGWQIRRAIEEWRRLKASHYDETLTNLSNDSRVQESLKRLIPDLEAQKK